MNVYFTASIVGKKDHLQDYLKIIRILEEKGYTVQAKHIIDSTEEQIRIEKAEKRREFHKQLEKWISSADFLVAEVTFPSISVGYEISMAVHKGKPVLLLYRDGDGPSLLIDHANERLICERYGDYSLKEIIDDFLRYIAGTSDTRFTFYLTSEMNNYLEKTAKSHRLPKAAYLRELIKKDILNKEK